MAEAEENSSGEQTWETDEPRELISRDEPNELVLRDQASE